MDLLAQPCTCHERFPRGGISAHAWRTSSQGVRKKRNMTPNRKLMPEIRSNRTWNTDAQPCTQSSPPEADHVRGEWGVAGSENGEATGGKQSQRSGTALWGHQAAEKGSSTPQGDSSTRPELHQDLRATRSLPAPSAFLVINAVWNYLHGYSLPSSRKRDVLFNSVSQHLERCPAHKGSSTITEWMAQRGG